MALALAVGLLGGVAFWWLATPLPWLLGPLFISLVVSLLRLPVEAPTPLRIPISAFVGVMLGATYSPEVLGQMAGWWLTILGLLGYMVIATAMCFLYFRAVAGFDARTAFFSAMPGGLSEMVIIGDSAGADPRNVALVQAGRVVFTVYSIPFLIEFMNGPLNRVAGQTVGLADMQGSAFLWLGLCAAAGLALGYLVKLPARFLIVPMVLSAVVHLAGWSDFKTPWEFVVAAQVILGTILGCGFQDGRVREILRVLLISLGATFLLVLLSLGFAWTLSWMSGVGLTELLLAYSPGGVAEMGVLALALQLEVAMVSLHHAIRIVVLVFAAASLVPLVVRLSTRGSRP